jgi:hypothetical protein
MKWHRAFLGVATISASAIAQLASADVVVFRNDAAVEIEFSVRDTKASTPQTQRLLPRARVQFDLDPDAEYDICATGLDQLNGTFGRSRVRLVDLTGNGNEVGIDGVICRGQRTAIILKFTRLCSRGRFRRRCYYCTQTMRVPPASQEYKNWFYYDSTPRDDVAR